MGTSQLMDLLAKYTADYTKMLSEGINNEEYERCRMIIKALQAEIDFRKKNDLSNSGDPPDFS